MYWEQKPQQNNIIVPTFTIVNTCLDFTTVTKVKNTRTCFQSNQSRKEVQKITICLTDSYHDLIFDRIKLRDTIEYEIKKVLMRGVNK